MSIEFFAVGFNRRHHRQGYLLQNRREFVEEALAQAEERLEPKYHLRARGYDFGKVVTRVVEVTGMDSAEVLTVGKYRRLPAARELGMRQDELSLLLKISQPAVSMAMRRGEKLAADNNFRLIPD